MNLCVNLRSSLETWTLWSVAALKEPFLKPAMKLHDKATICIKHAAKSICRVIRERQWQKGSFLKEMSTG